MLRKEACSGSIADLSHIRTQWCLADCLTKKSANPQALIDAVRQGILKEVDAHPFFRTLVEHQAYLRSWLPSVCHHVNFALDVFFLGECFHWQMCAENLFACWHFCSLVRWMLPSLAWMPCWKKLSFLFMNLCLRLNYFSLYSFVSVVCVCSLLSLVAYFLPRKMATSDYDVISGSEEEYQKTTWFNEPRTCTDWEKMPPCDSTVPKGHPACFGKCDCFDCWWRTRIQIWTV